VAEQAAVLGWMIGGKGDPFLVVTAFTPLFRFFFVAGSGKGFVKRFVFVVKGNEFGLLFAGDGEKYTQNRNDESDKQPVSLVDFHEITSLFLDSVGLDEREIDDHATDNQPPAYEREH
jgi:hypothetical protein